MLRRSNILGFDIVLNEVVDVVGQTWLWIESREPVRVIACANPHSLVVAKTDVEFRNALLHADVLLPDGAGITLAWRMLDHRGAGRITGFDYFRALTASAADRHPLRYFFLGSSERVLGAMRNRIKGEYPYVEIVGMHSPPFKTVFSSEDDTAMISAINASGADVLWVGMTAPKQEKWIERNRSKLNVPVCVAVGAVFDFLAGTVRRPQWACDLGVEWLVRLVQEPRRLWRRSIVSAPIFVVDVLRQKFAR